MTASAYLPRAADFACVPIGGAPGKLVALGEALAGDGFSHYEHAFVYLGYLDAATPLMTSVGGTSWEHWLRRHDYTTPGMYRAQAQPGGAGLVRMGLTPADALAVFGDDALWSQKVSSPLTRDQRYAIIRAAIEALGTPYSWLDYAALASHHLHIPGPGLRNYIATSKHMICSQYVDWCYQQAQFALFSDDRWDGYVMPADLARLELAA